jgi:hypothetical protein
VTAKRVASAKRATDKQADDRLRKAREMVENVLWNLDHSTEDEALGGGQIRQNWRVVFSELREVLG